MAENILNLCKKNISTDITLIALYFNDSLNKYQKYIEGNDHMNISLKNVELGLNNPLSAFTEENVKGRFHLIWNNNFEKL